MSGFAKGVIAGTLGTIALLSVTAYLVFRTYGFSALPAPSGDDAFSGLLAQIVESAQYIESETEPGSTDRIEGQRYLLRSIGRGLAFVMGVQESATPTISRCPSLPCKFGFDNPDATYVSIGPLNASNTYRIWGHRGDVNYITYQVFQFGGGGFQTFDTMESGDLTVNDDGSYEIFLSAGSNVDERDNFLSLPDRGNGSLIIRQIHNDWNQEIEQTYQVERLNDLTTPINDPIMNDAFMGKRATALSIFLRNSIPAFRKTIANLAANDIPIPSNASLGGGGGFPSNTTAATRYEIDDDHALIIETPYVETVYQNIQLGNLWGESLDYATRIVSYNGSQAHKDSDGKIRYVIATKDVGVANWLDAEGHPKGGLFMRWQSPNSQLAKPVTKLVSLAELRDHLPADHPDISAAERSETLRARLRGYNRRTNPMAPKG